MAELENMVEVPHYNARPTQNLPVVLRQGEKNKLVIGSWGLTPEWMKGKLLYVSSGAEGKRRCRLRPALGGRTSSTDLLLF